MSDLVPAIGDGGLSARPRGDEGRLPHAESHGGEIAFVDAGISDLATLVAGLKPGVEVVMLDSAHDAIGQIVAALAGRDSLAAIHIIANGGEGRIDFGAGGFGLDDLASHAEELAAIGEALGVGGDILLWSCNTGAGSIGQAFIDSLAQATGADVAASTDPTGAAARGGDWVLEAQSGAIEAHAPLTPRGVDAYDGLLDNEPSGADKTVTLNEDGTHVFATADFGFADGGEGNALAGVVITTLPDAGTLTLLGVAVTAGQTVSAEDIDAGRLVFTPAANANGANYANFTFQVQDDGGSNNLDLSPNTITLDVDAVNDAPTGTTPASVTTTVNVAVAITGLSAADAEMNPATDEFRSKLIVSGGAGTIEIRTDVPGGITAGQIINNGSESVFFWNGITLDQLNTTFAASNGVVFTPASGMTGTYSILFGGTDGGVSGIDPGGDPSAEGFDLSFDVIINAAANSAPTLNHNDGLSLAEGATADITATLLDFNDAEQADTAITYTITSATTNGALKLNGSTLGVNDTFTQADINNGLISYLHDGSETTSDSFEYSVSDGAGGSVTGQSFTITVTPVNDAPTLDLDFIDATATGNDAAAAWAQGDAPVVLAPFAVFDDDDADGSYPGATLTIAFTANGTAHDQLSVLSVGDGTGELRVTGTNVYYEGTLVGTLSGGDDGNPLVVTFNADACHCAIQLVAESITFTNDGATPDTTDRIISFTLVDGGGTANGGFDTATADVTLSITAANIVPSVTIDAPIVPIGGEHLVNTTTDGPQQGAQITALDDGGYVIVWSSGAADFSDTSIVGQRYAADGTPIGNEFAIDTLGQFDITQVSVTSLDGGGFVVAWQDDDPTLGHFVAAQVYDDLGDPAGSVVAVTAPGEGGSPVIARLGGGAFVVTWLADDGDVIGVHAQLFDDSGTALGSSFIANGTTTGTQTNQSVAGLADGGFVVTWTSFNTDSDFTEVFARRFDASGSAVGPEFLVPSAPTGDQSGSTVTGLANGGFVVTWTQAPTFSDVNAHAQLYDAAGNPVGTEFVVDTPSAARQGAPTVTALADGGFLITWKSGDVSGVGDIYGHRYAADGSEVGGEFRVTDASLERYAPVVAGLADGGFAIAWMSLGQDGSGGGIYSQVYDPQIAAVEQVPLDLKGSIHIADADAGASIITVTLTVTEGVLAIDAGTSGVSVDDSDAQNIVLTGTLAEIEALLGSDLTSSVTYTYDDDFLPLGTLALGVTIDDGFDSATDTVLIGLTPVNDAAELDLDFLTPGNDAVATYVAGDPAVPISFNASFDDDNANWDGATLTVAITGATGGDQLSIDETLTVNITVVGSNIFYQGDLVGSFTGGANGNPLVVTFNADACACAIEEVTYGIAYSNSGTVTALSTRDVTYTFVDGGGTANGGHDTATATVELTVTPAPTPPVIDAGTTANGNEDTPFALTGITITDAGDPTTGLITVHLGVEHGTLTIRTDVPGGIDASSVVNSASGHGITIIATPDQINATLAASGLTYLGDANFNGADALTITANDGTPDTALALSSLGAQPFDFPSAVAFHDVDGDGFDDLILGVGDGSSPSGVLVLAGGIGGFGLPSGAADAFAFGDFDGDGTVDIGIASYAADGSGYVTYFSSLSGALETVDNIPYALDLVAGDFNGDGLTDLAVANSDSGNIAILLQTAPGAFAPPVYSSATSLLTVSIRAADFNGDGVLDLLASNFGDSTGFAPPGSIDLFLGNGDGSFAAATQVWTGPSNADGLVVGDFNGDGIQDFAFASVDSVGVPGGVNGVQVVLGNGDGTFGAATGYVTTAGGSPHAVAGGDLNNDGILDLVVTNSDTPGTVSILLGNGDGSFQAPVDLDTGDLPYVVALGDPDDDGDLDLIVGSAGDGTYEAFNNDDFHRGTTAVKPIAVAGSAVAQADAASIAENAISTGNLFLNNGFGADSDSDGDALVIALVNGSAANVGTTITLASGAKLTVNADGSYTYDPNGKFVTLTDGSSGAANTSATDSFTYTLAGGNTATVTITLNGVAGAGDRLQGDLTHDVINGTGGADFFIDTAGGNEDWTGLGGNDVFLFGATLTSADKVDGGAGADQLAIQGDYSTQLTLGTGIVGVEYMAILPGSDTRFGDPGTNSYDYNIKTVDQNVAAGVTFTIDANRLSVGEDFTFDGSAETDGKFFIWGGGGTDTLTGGTQNDTFYFGELGQFGATDTVNGGAGTDQLGLRGDYSIVFGAAQLTSIENIGMVSAFDTRFGALGASFDYNLTMDDGNVATGQQMTVDAAALRASETLTFNGSAELDGSFRVFGGAGNDVIVGSHGDDILIGWAGADTLTGGLGNDVFRYNLASDSTSASHDTIQDFTLGDIIDLSRIDANSGVNGDQAFSFIGNTAFGHHAGELRYENVSGSTWTVQGDTDGDGVADFEVVVVITDGHGFTGGDFLM